jgi:heptosyltransferase-1
MSKEILLVKTSSLGDVIHFLPAVSDIKAYLPDSDIDWLVEEAFAGVPRLHPGVRDVIPVSLRRWRRRLFKKQARMEIGQFVRGLRQLRHDYVIDSQGLMKSAVLAALARGPVYGADRASAREPLASAFYKYKVPVPRERHAVERGRILAAGIFGYEIEQMPLNYGIACDEPRADWLPPGRYVACLHGTSRASKFWAEDRWVALLRELIAAAVVPVLPWGNAAERERSDRLAKEVAGAVVAPQQTLGQLAGMLAGADAVVGVDTGPVHLAVALGRPTVALYTDTDPVQTGVYPMPGKTGINLGGIGAAPAVVDVVDALKGIGLY